MDGLAGNVMIVRCLDCCCLQFFWKDLSALGLCLDRISGGKAPGAGRIRFCYLMASILIWNLLSFKVPVFMRIRAKRHTQLAVVEKEQRNKGLKLPIRLIASLPELLVFA